MQGDFKISAKNWLKYILILLSIIIIRNALEMYLKRPGFWNLTSLEDWMNWWIHFPLFYIVVFLFGIIGSSAFLKISFIKAGELMLCLIAVILLGPIIDLFTTGGDIPYLYVKSPEYLFTIFIELLNFSKDLLSYGIPYGPRIEVLIVLILIPFLSWDKINGGLFRKIFIVVLMQFFSYVGVFVMCVWPGLFNGILSRGIQTNYSTYSEIYLLLTTIGIIVIYSNHFEYRKYFVTFIRPYRFIHYFLLILGGFIISMQTLKPIIDFKFYLDVISGVLSFTMAFISLNVLNDFTDKIEDMENNRCYLKGNLFNRTHLIIQSLMFYTLSLLFGFLCNSAILTIIFLWTAFTIVYSVIPFRLKKYFLLSNSILALSAVLAVVYGVSLSGSVDFRNVIDKRLYLLIFLVTFIGSFIKDIPDRNGDKKSNIVTLPVLFDPEKFKVVYFLLIFICYLITFYFVIKFSLFAWLLFIPFLLSIFSILRESKKNRLLYASYFTSLMMIVIIFILK